MCFGIKAAVLAVFLLSINVAFPSYVSQPNYSSRPTYSSDPQKMHRRIRENGSDILHVAGSDDIGKIKTSNNSIILNGITIKNDSHDIGKININSNKRVILNNVKIISRNSTEPLVNLNVRSNNLILRNVRVNAVNSSVHDKNCAASICLHSSGSNRRVYGMKVFIQGQNYFKSE